MIDDLLQGRSLLARDIEACAVGHEEIGMNVNPALAGIGEDDEFVAEIAADRPGVGAHRDRLQPHAVEGPQIGDEHLVVGVPRAGRVEIEAVGVLHQKLAPAHDAKARPDLVTEFPLDVVEQFRQIAIALDRGADDFGYLFFVGRAVQHLAVVAVADAQHLLAVIVIAPALAPQLGGLDRRHQDFLGTGAVLLLADDRLDLFQDAQP